jgi:hypothetical protein
LIQAKIALAGHIIDNFWKNRPEGASQRAGFTTDATHIPAFDQAGFGAFERFFGTDGYAKGVLALATIDRKFGDFQQTKLPVITTMIKIFTLDFLHRITRLI